MTRRDEPRRLLRSFCLIAVGLAVPIGSPATGAAAAAPLGRLLSLAAVGQAEFGTIKGRLVWDGPSIPPNKVLVEKGKAPNNADVCAKNQAIVSHELEIDPKTKGVAYGFAYIVRPKGTNPELVAKLVAKNPKVEIDQKNCDFVPHSLALHQDQSVLMKSSDAASHNVRLTGFNNAGINQVLAANGQLDVKLVAERLPMYVKCDIHPWMHGHIMVFDHPFFSVTGPDGSFEIKGVPAGDQNVVVWQETIGYVTPNKVRGMPVKVVGGQVTDLGEIKLGSAK